MPKPYRTLAEIMEALDAEGAPTTDPYLGFYTEQELADRWGIHVTNLGAMRRDGDIAIPPYFVRKKGGKVMPLYPKRAVWLFEMEHTFR